MDSTTEALTARGVSHPARRILFAALFTLCLSLLALIPTCRADPRIPLGGVWEEWESAKNKSAQKLLRLVPEDLFQGLTPNERFVQSRAGRRGFRAVVAQHEGDVLLDPLTIYMSALTPEDPRPDMPGQVVRVGGVKAALNATTLGTNVRWRKAGYENFVVGDAYLRQPVLATARAMSFGHTGPLTFTTVPRGFRVVSIAGVAEGPVRVANSTYRSRVGAMRDVSITTQFAEGFTPLLPAVPLHADAGTARRTRVRGADAILRSSVEPDVPGGASSERLSLTWLEHDNLLVTIQATGTGLSIEMLRRLARSLKRMAPEEWNQRFRER